MTNAQRKTLREAADIILDQTDQGENVIIRGFGTFKRVDKPARVARNPMTGGDVQVPPKSVLKFTASKQTVETL